MTRKAGALLLSLVMIQLTGGPGGAEPPQPARPPRGAPAGPSPAAAAPAASKPGAMSAGEKLVRHAYMKLMRYQSAAVAEQAVGHGGKTEPKDFVSFGIAVL